MSGKVKVKGAGAQPQMHTHTHTLSLSRFLTVGGDGASADEIQRSKRGLASLAC